MALVSANQFQTVPELSRLGAGFQQGQQIGAGIDARQLAQQQQEAQAAQQAQLGGLQQQVLAGQNPQVTQPLGGQGALLPVEQQAGQQQAQGLQALAEIAVRFPQQFDEINANLGLITQQQKDEAADFAFDMKNTPFEQRPAKIRQRVATLSAQGRTPGDTASLEGLPQAEQDRLLDAVQVAALSPEKRLEAAKGGAQGLASAKTEFLPGGGSVQALPDGRVVVKDASERVLEGQERAELLRTAEEFKVKQAEQLAQVDIAKARGVASATNTEKRISNKKVEFADKIQGAARKGIKLNAALNAAATADQGLRGSVKLQLAKIFPDIDVSSEATLDQALLQLTIDQLTEFKGPTTDFEFDKSQATIGTVGDSKSANIARLKSLQRNAWFVRREADQFNDHAKDGGDTDNFAFNFNQIVKTKKGGFTLREIQDTAADANLSIEETLERLNK